MANKTISGASGYNEVPGGAVAITDYMLLQRGSTYYKFLPTQFPIADGVNPGLMAPASVAKLAGIQSGATDDLTAAEIIALINAALGGTTWQGGGGGGGVWGTFTGLLSNQTDLQNALNAKADLLAPVTLSANTPLTAAAHANRTILVNAAGVVLTHNLDATSGLTTDDAYDIQAIGAGSFTFVAGTGTIDSGSGTSADSTTAVGKRVQAQRTAANTVRVISPAIVAAGGNNRAVADATTYTLVDNTVDNIVTTLTLGTIAVGTLIEIDYHIDQATAGVNGDAVLSWDLGTTLITFQATPASSTSTGKVARCTMFVKALTGADNVYATWPLLNDGGNATDPVQKATVTLTGSVTLRLRAQKAAAGVGRAMRIQMINVNVRQP